MDAKAVALPLIDSLRRALEQVTNATSDELVFKEYMKCFGWDINVTTAEIQQIRTFMGVEPVNAILGGVAQSLESGTGNEAQLVTELIHGILKGIDTIKLWSSQGGIAALPTPFNTPEFWSDFPENLISNVTASALSRELPALFAVFAAFGIIDREVVGPPGPNRLAYVRIKVYWSKLSDLFSDPVALLKSSFKWDIPGKDFDHEKFVQVVGTLIKSTGMTPRLNSGPASLMDLYYTPGNPVRSKVSVLDLPFLVEIGDAFSTSAELGFRILPITPSGNMAANPSGFMIGPLVSGSVQGSPSADSPWRLVAKADGLADGFFRLEFLPTGVNMVIDPSAASVDSELRLEGRFPEPWIMIGAPNSHRIELEGVFVSLGVRGRANDPEILFKAGTGEGQNPPRIRFIFQAREGDGFLQKLVGSEPKSIDLAGHLSVSSKYGVGISGSIGFELEFPLHLSLGPVEIDSIRLGFRAGSDHTLKIPLGITIKAKLGPLSVVVEEIGAQLLMMPKEANESGGLFGNMDLDWGFKPPNGVGLSIDTGVVKGGGYLYFDFDKEEYAGVLELGIAGIVTVKAIGLITTKMPDGSKGFSLLLIITAEFGTGIQLGFGFTLIGVGGLLGLNRTMLLEPLAAGIRTGAINSIMFPPNPVENAPRIISDLRTYFPPYEGKFLIGPMVKIGWGTPTLVSLSFGLIIEIPGNIAIVGVLSVNLPTADAPVVAINVAFLGALEFDKKRIWFFASLFDSRILFLTLEGDMGLLMDYGDNPNFVLSVGGFHPLFNPPPLPFPNPRRIHIDVLSNPFQRISVEGYFAVTSNTVQFGASAELYFGLAVVSIKGHFSFDALFQFSPFKFIIQMSFSVSLEAFGFGLFSIHLRLQLEGPTPWRAQGTGTLTIDLWLFEISISADFDVTWGDAENTTLPSVDVLPLLEIEFNKVDNWRAKTPPGNNLLVSIRKLEGGTDGLVLHPLGTLQISQRAVPLHVKVDKVGNRVAADAHTFSVTAATTGLSDSGQAPQEKFAIAQFQDLSNDEKLTRPAFQDFDGGIELSFAGRQLGATKAVRRVVRYETIIIDTNYKRFVRKWFSLIGTLFTHFLNGAAVTKSTLSHAQKKAAVPYGVDDRIKVAPPAYAVAGMADNKVLGETTLFASEAQARDFMNVQLEANPAMAGEVHVIPAFEAVMN